MSESTSEEAGAQRFAQFLPLLLDLEREARSRHQIERLVVVDHGARTVAVFEGALLDSLLLELLEKSGPPPASKASIDALPRVMVTETAGDRDCTICLEEFEVGGEAREMPCEHSFHSICIEKWLAIHGSCPVCRFEMPVEDKDEERRERREGGVVLVNLWISDRGRIDGVSDEGASSSSGSGPADSSSDLQAEWHGDSIDGSSTQDMEC